jgi:carboxyl-terminal processing protease
MQVGTNGAVIGVGLEVAFNTSNEKFSNQDLVVVAPVSGGPAARAGVLPGDLIMAIDGVPTHGMGLYDAAQRLQ